MFQGQKLERFEHKSSWVGFLFPSSSPPSPDSSRKRLSMAESIRGAQTIADGSNRSTRSLLLQPTPAFSLFPKRYRMSFCHWNKYSQRVTKAKGEGGAAGLTKSSSSQPCSTSWSFAAVLSASDTRRPISGSFSSFATDSGAQMKSLLTHPGPGSPAHARRLIRGDRIASARTHGLIDQNALQGKMKENCVSTCRS